MESEAELAQAALKAMRKWQWLRLDPDGSPFSPSLKLGLVVNRLAMGGMPRPQSAVLTLLCQGDLISTGDYRWRKYQWGSDFYLEGSNATLETNQWKTLKNLICDERKKCDDFEWHTSVVDLVKLELPQCDIYEWAFSHSRFTTALCPPETSTFDPNYYEEWFSAWDIEVCPRQIRECETDSEDSPAAPCSGDIVGPVLSKRGRPVAYDWLEATNSIWAKLYGNELKPNTQADIEKALIQHLRKGDIEPGESTVRPFAKAIWEKFQEH